MKLWKMVGKVAGVAALSVAPSIVESTDIAKLVPDKYKPAWGMATTIASLYLRRPQDDKKGE